MAIGLVKGNTVVGIKEEATAATGTIQIINNTFDGGDAVIVNGVTFTEGTEWSAGASINDSATNLAAAINNSNNFLVNGVLSANAVTDTVTITADLPGTAGNSITLAETDNATDNFTLSGATLSGGAFSEGTAAAPASATDFVQVLEDGLEVSPAKEQVERDILTSSIGKVTPRVSTKSVSGTLPIEFRAQGTEGGVPQYDVILRSALGSRRKLVNRITTGSSHTTTTLNIASADTIFQKGDFIVILEAGAHHRAFVTSVASGSINFLPAADSAPSDSVELAKSVTYSPANVDHPTFTKSVYWGNEIREQAIGSRVTTLSVENFTTGQIPNLSFAHEGLSFDEIDGAAPFTPSFDAGLPPLALNVALFQDGVCVDANEFALSIENTVAFLTSVKSADGRINSRVNERTVSGSFNPYKDDTSVANFTKFDQNSLFEIIVTAGNNSSTTGEFDLGSNIGIYLPQCILTEKTVGDADGVLLENLSFSANRGTDGTEDEVFIGFV